MREEFFLFRDSTSFFIVCPDESIFDSGIFYLNIFSEEGIIGGAGASESRVVAGDGAVVLSGERGLFSSDDEIVVSLCDCILISYHCDIVCAGILLLYCCLGSDFVFISRKEGIVFSVVDFIFCSYDRCGIGSTAGILESSDLD